MVCKMKTFRWKGIIFLIAGIALLAVFSVCFRNSINTEKASLSRIDLADGNTNEDGNFSLHEGIRLAASSNDNLLGANESSALALNSSAATVEFGGTTTNYESFAEAWSVLTSASTSADSQAKITLYADVDPTEYQSVALTGIYDYLFVKSGQYITLDLNGHTIDRGLSEQEIDGYVISVAGNLTIKDSSGDNSGKITGGHNMGDGGGVYVINGGAFTLEGGTITGNTTANYGGGVYVNDGEFTMSGGSMTGNSASCGGGVYVSIYKSVATFTMSGGTIKDNNGENGGGVYVFGGTFTMSDGMITGNSAMYGGGVYVFGGTFTMSDGMITGNSAMYGGGVYVFNGTGANGTFTMSGGTISGNSASSRGGGVYVSDATFNISGNASVTGNVRNGTRDESTGMYTGTTARNVYLVTGSFITLNDTFTGSVGVTTASAPTAGNDVTITSGYSTYGTGGTFTSDNSSYYAVLGNNELMLSTETPKFATVEFDGTTTNYATFAEAWSAATSASTSEDSQAKITLYADVDSTEYQTAAAAQTNSYSYLCVESNKYITIDLNGYTIDRGLTALTSNGYVISVAGGLTIMDTSTSQTGTITGGYNNSTSSGHGGGGVCVYGGTFTMTGGTITSNSTSSSGGGVYVYGGTFTMTDGIISGNEVLLYGGGVYVFNGTFTMSGGTVSNNFSLYGGGVYADYLATFRMDDGIIKDNSTTYYGGGVYTAYRFTMTGGSITGNTVNNSASNGGGVCVVNDFNISGNASVTGNTVNNSASNVYLFSGYVITLTAEFTGEVGVMTETAPTADSPVTITSGYSTYGTNGTFTSSYNSYMISESNGELSLEVAAATVEFNGTTTNYTTFAEAWSAATGEITSEDRRATVTLLAEADIEAFITVESNQYITLDLNGNTLDRGLTEAIENGYVILVRGNLIINDSSGNNSGKITGGYNSSDYSGCIFVSTGTLTLNGGTITKNTVTGTYGGGGVYVFSGGTFEMNGGVISYNTATQTQYGGGGVNAGTGSFTMNGGTISNNTAYNGGGIRAGSFTDLLEITGGTITNNSATNNGGGVYVFNATFNLSGSAQIIGNTVNDSANNVYLADAVVITLTAEFTGEVGVMTKPTPTANSSVTVTSGYSTYGTTGTFTSDYNSYMISESNGELVLWVPAATVEFNGGTTNYFTFAEAWSAATDTRTSATSRVTITLYANVGADEYSAAASAQTGYYAYLRVANGKYITLDLNGFKVDRGLTASTSDGYVIYVSGDLTVKDSSGDNSGKITGGYSSNGGGGVYVYTSATLTMSGGTITGNSAGRDGGGVYVYNGTFTMTDGAISGNYADATGGGVYLLNGTFTLEGGEILDNSANMGGGVYVNGASSMFTMKSGGTISDNSASGGGGVWLNSGAFIMEGGSITNNKTSSSSGGGVLIEGGMFAMSGGMITGNTASIYYGGGVYVGNGTFRLSGSASVTDNVSGGAFNAGTGLYEGGTANNVYLATGSLIYLNSTFTGTVGVTTATAPTAESSVTITDGYSNYGEEGVFTSDRTLYMVVTDNGELVLELAAATVEYNGEITGYATFAEAWSAATEASTDADNRAIITLNADVGADEYSAAASAQSGSYAYLSVANGKYITLDLNGCTIDRGGEYSASGYVFYVGGDLTIQDSSQGGSGKITGGNANYGIFVAGAFTMNGGTITGNTATSSGGGVFVDGTFTMNGGTIKDNNGENGGGVYVFGGTFTMTGGTITDNSANGNGGGVYVIGTFNLSGAAQITGNTKGGEANNVYLSQQYFYTTYMINLIEAFTGEVGITTAIAPTESSPVVTVTSGYSAYGAGGTFTSDSSAYPVGLFNGETVLHVHSYKSAMTTLPTCTDKGEKTYTCLYCDDSYPGEVDATGHRYEFVWSEDGTTATCVCQNDETHTLNVTMGSEYTAPTCTEDGYTIYTATAEDGKTATNKVIDIGSVIGHAWNGGTINGAVKTYKCSICDETKPVALASIRATYTSDITVFTSTELDSLKQYLTVVLIWDDNTQDGINEEQYVLSGTLTAGNSTITITYASSYTTTFEVEVTAVIVTELEITRQPTKVEYTALEEFDGRGMIISVTYNDGTKQDLENFLDFSYRIDGQSDNRLRYGTNGRVTVFVGYDGVWDSITVTVHKITIAVPEAIRGLVYNGQEQTGVAADGNKYTVTGGSATNAGTYTATVMLADEENYAWLDDFNGVISYTIAKAEYDMSHITFDDIVFVEDGSKKGIYVSGALPQGVTVSYQGNEQITCGRYTVIASFIGDEENYEAIPDLTAALTINQASIAYRTDDSEGKAEIIISSAHGFSPEASLAVTKETKPSADMESAIAGNESISAIYTLVLQENGGSIQADGEITIRVLLPASVANQTFRILATHENEIKEINYTLEGDYVVFTIDQLSDFVVVVDNSVSMLWLIFTLFGILIIELGLILFKKRKPKRSHKAYSITGILGIVAYHEIALLIILGVAVIALGAYTLFLYLPRKKKTEAIEEIPEETSNNEIEVVSNSIEGIAETTLDNTIEEATEVSSALVPVRFNRSFVAKLILSEEKTKVYFAELANYLLSFKGIKHRLSWKNISFYQGRKCIAKMSIRGKTLWLFLAMNPEEFAGSKYRGENFSDSAHYMKVPFAVKIKSERGKKYAKELIHILMNRMHIELGQTSTLFSAAEYPYSTQKSLIDRGLIKVYYSEQIPENAELISQKIVIHERISANEAHSLIQDSQALELIQPSARKRERGKRLSINIDTLGASFAAGDTVDIDILKEKKLIPKTADSVKILARGILDKPLTVIADDFSVDAVKMIVLTGGKAIQR